MPSGLLGSPLAIGNASTSVAVAMGELEGKFPDVIVRWAERDKELRQIFQLQGFKCSMTRSVCVCVCVGCVCVWGGRGVCVCVGGVCVERAALLPIFIANYVCNQR